MPPLFLPHIAHTLTDATDNRPGVGAERPFSVLLSALGSGRRYPHPVKSHPLWLSRDVTLSGALGGDWHTPCSAYAAFDESVTHVQVQASAVGQRADLREAKVARLGG